MEGPSSTRVRPRILLSSSRSSACPKLSDILPLLCRADGNHHSLDKDIITRPRDSGNRDLLPVSSSRDRPLVNSSRGITQVILLLLHLGVLPTSRTYSFHAYTRQHNLDEDGRLNVERARSRCFSDADADFSSTLTFALYLLIILTDMS